MNKLVEIKSQKTEKRGERRSRKEFETKNSTTVQNLHELKMEEVPCSSVVPMYHDHVQGRS